MAASGTQASAAARGMIAGKSGGASLGASLPAVQGQRPQTNGLGAANTAPPAGNASAASAAPSSCGLPPRAPAPKATPSTTVKPKTTPIAGKRKEAEEPRAPHKQAKAARNGPGTEGSLKKELPPNPVRQTPVQQQQQQQQQQVTMPPPAATTPGTAAISSKDPEAEAAQLEQTPVERQVQMHMKAMLAAVHTHHAQASAKREAQLRAQHQADLGAVQRQLGQLTATVLALEGQVAEGKEACQQADQRVAAIKVHSGTVKANLAAEQAKRREAEGRATDLQLQLAAEQAKRRQAEHREAALKVQGAPLQAQLTALQAKRKLEAEQAQRKLAAEQAKRQEAQQHAINLQSLLDAKLKECQEAEGRANNLQAQLAAEQAKRRLADQRESAGKAQAGILRAQVAAERAQCQEAEGRAFDLQTQVEEERAQLEKERAQHHLAVARFASQTSQLDKIQAILSRAKEAEQSLLALGLPAGTAGA